MGSLVVGGLLLVGGGLSMMVTGVLGRVYWYAILPLHAIVFRGLLRHAYNALRTLNDLYIVEGLKWRNRPLVGLEWLFRRTGTAASNHFEGGGHKNASGGKSNLSLIKTEEKFLKVLELYKNALNQKQ